jgi:serine/threonine protein kinase
LANSNPNQLGGELFDEITRNAQRGLGEAHAAKLMCDMLSAVRYLHEQGIAHRDLKLENFLFEQPGIYIFIYIYI